MPVNPSAPTGDRDHTSPPRRTQAERSAATRSALIEAARRLFAERGYVDTPREEICRRAGVTRGALDHHFDGKYGLFRAVVEAVEEDLGRRIVAAAVREPDALAQIRAGCRVYLDTADDPEIRRILLSDARAVLDDAEWEEIQASHGLGLTMGALQEAMDAGAIPARPAEPLARILLAGLNAAVMYVCNASDRTRTRARREAEAEIERLLDGLLG